MTDIDMFAVSANDITVVCASAGASWGFSCSDEKCTFVTVGWEAPDRAGAGAVHHLRWHADGKRECDRCGCTLTADDPGRFCDECFPAAAS